jgi:hypothetical protein
VEHCGSYKEAGICVGYSRRGRKPDFCCLPFGQFYSGFHPFFALGEEIIDPAQILAAVSEVLFQYYT